MRQYFPFAWVLVDGQESIRLGLTVMIQGVELFVDKIVAVDPSDAVEILGVMI